MHSASKNEKWAGSKSDRHGLSCYLSPANQVPQRIIQILTAQLTALEAKNATLRRKAENLPPHLRLGISYDGISLFLVRIGFLSSRFAYNPAYTRDKSMSWIDEVHGPVEYADCGANREHKHIQPPSMTGYDLCFSLRKWLKANGHGELSVCEVILLDPRYEDLRHHVGQAVVFYSHIQSVHPIATFNNLLNGMRDHEKFDKTATFWWIDYFSLRQCQNDFKPEQVVQLVEAIGITMAELPCTSDLSYFRRSFCILELYATLKGRADLMFSVPGDGAGMKRALEAEPINTAAAATRSLDDKDLIDAFITQSLGFERMDAAVTAAAIKGAGGWTTTGEKYEKTADGVTSMYTRDQVSRFYVQKLTFSFIQSDLPPVVPRIFEVGRDPARMVGPPRQRCQHPD
jgi:hypothetical protein